MSLTFNDLQSIREIVKETIDPIKGDLEALSNDVKEIYSMLANLEKRAAEYPDFNKKNLEQKLLSLHADIVAAAKQAGVTLPTHQ